ncbi:hypothetical protein GCM10009092_26970 [Bowmanella denitrificans]|uniref:Uncharacterized protein n=1 Tax=Bowmanella denitrificans TaxID=366582 RepID=A0ABN0XDG6_9ALTE
MDFNSSFDGVVLITCGVLVLLYGAGVLFPTLAKAETIARRKMKSVMYIGLGIIVVGIVQLLRGLV